MATKFTRTDKAMAKEPRGQAALILAVLNEATGPVSIKEITEQIKDNLVTRQDPERVVAYYITMYKKQGLVKTVAEATETAPAATEAPAEVSNEVELEA